MGSKRKRRRKAFKNRPFYDKLIIPTDVYQKIRALTLEASGEISGFGRTSLVQEDGVFGGTELCTTLIVERQERFELSAFTLAR